MGAGDGSEDKRDEAGFYLSIGNAVHWNCVAFNSLPNRVIH